MQSIVIAALCLVTLAAAGPVALPHNLDLSVPVDEYYKNVDTSLRDVEFIESLQKVVGPHKQVSYAAIWEAFQDIDEHDPGSNCTGDDITGIYSAYCWTAPNDQCGSYKKEGDCFNREHSYPKSWWGGMGKGSGASYDAHHLFPSDGYVNGLRSNLPLGVVSGEPSYVSTNGAKIGDCRDLAGNRCFEPPSSPMDWRGDLARGYFYLMITYRGQWSCCDTAGTDRSSLKPWMEKTLREWHTADPVSDLEARRNDLIYSDIQGNRNPFIDHPEWLDNISSFSS